MLDPTMVTPARLINFLSGVLFIFVGAWVLTLKPRRATNVAFGLFGITYGLAFVVINGLLMVGAPLMTAAVTQIPFLVASSFSLGALALLAPRRPRRSGLPKLLAAVFAAALLVAAVYASDIAAGDFDGLATPWLVALVAGSVAAFFAFLAFPTRHGSSANTPLDRLQMRYLATAMVAFPALEAGLGLISAANLGATLSGATDELTLVGVYVLVAVAWLVQAARAHAPEDARGARRVALATLGFVFAGIAIPAFLPLGYAPGAHPVRGIVRAVSVMLLAYGIVRGQVFGLDGKVNWTVRRGTVAAAFLGAFFVGVQIAQEWLGDEYGALMGGGAAGMLLFVHAPIQRLADRIADSTVPLGEALAAAPASSPASDPATVAAAASAPVAATAAAVAPAPARAAPPEEHERTYRTMLRIALADRVVTRDEQVALMELADRLGISARRAMELRFEVEHEVAG